MAKRALVIFFFFFVAVVLSATSIYQEQIPDGRSIEEAEGRDEPLRHIKYVPSNRTDNFREMGLPADIAELASKEARKLDPNKKRFRKLLETQALEVGDAFCPQPSGLPQPYAAMEFLVEQEAGERDVVQARKRLFAFEKQSWFRTDSNPTQIYEVMERTKRRRPDATLMGVAALLSKHEADADQQRGAWAVGMFGGGDFSMLEGEMPSMRQKIVEYFALMHFLTELANQSGGICDLQ